MLHKEIVTQQVSALKYQIWLLVPPSIIMNIVVPSTSCCVMLIIINYIYYNTCNVLIITVGVYTIQWAYTAMATSGRRQDKSRGESCYALG